MKRIKQMMGVALLLGCMTNGILAQGIEVNGVVRDAESKEALAFVNVVLQTEDSVYVKGCISDENGGFRFTQVEAGDYWLAVSSVGYETQYVALKGLNENAALTDIFLYEEAVDLNAVTVTGSAVVNRIDRKLVFPAERQIQASSNGIDLLRQLMLPRLNVNPLTHEISIPGGGEVQLRINGVKVEVNEIVALLPADVIRVEYHDHPGLRYGNAAAVIDYIVRRYETGGKVGIDLMNTPRVGQFGNDGGNGRINHKKSEFSVNYSLRVRDFTQMWRDNEETFHLADGSVLRRKEAGEPARAMEVRSFLNAAYNYRHERRMFNVAFRYTSENRPRIDFNGRLFNMDNPEDQVQMSDHSSDRSSRPALDLYYQENLKNGQTLVVNLVGTFNYTDNERAYSESRDGIVLTSVNNSVTGNKYSWIGEGIYEKKIGNNRLGAGLRHTQANADNTYRNGHAYHTEMQQGETFLYAEWKGKAQKLDYTVSAGLTRASFQQESEGIDYNTYTFNPRMALFYPLTGQSSLRLTGYVGSNTPSLSNLSAIDQIIDSLQIQRGNPGLKPFLTYRSELTYEWQKGLFYASLKGTYEHKPSAIMDEKYQEGDKIIQTWDNQKSWQWMNAMANLRVGPVKDIATLSLHGGINHFISNGNNYRHVYDNPFLNITLNGTYRKFNLMFEWHKSWNHFEGETMNGGENIHILMLDYKYKNMNFGVGAFNPFADNYHMDAENRSAYASYKKKMYINDSSQMYFFRFSCNFAFGRTFDSGQKRLNNSDDDSGVMKAGK